MKKFDISEGSRGCERLVLQINGTRNDGTRVFELVDLSGNCTGAAKWGAIEAILAVNKLLERENNEGLLQP